MKQGLIERQRTRREIRKINRETRVDHQGHRRRIIVSAILIVCTLAFVAFEAYSILQSKRLHDQELAKKLADETTIELSLINAGFASSNQTMLKDAHRQYQESLAMFNANDYMKDSQADLLKQLNDYEQVLAQEEKDAHLIKLHTEITMLQKELEDTDLKEISTKSMIETKESFEDFRNSLDELQDERFQDLITELTDYSNEMITVIDKTAVCFGTCTKKTMKARDQELANIFAKYQETLVELDAQISAYYSPAKLIESLKMLQ